MEANKEKTGMPPKGLSPKQVGLVLAALSALAIYAFGKRVGEFIYYVFNE